MTLFDLMKRASDVGMKFSSWQIPLKFNGKDADISFVIDGNNDKGWVINIFVDNETD